MNIILPKQLSQFFTNKKFRNFQDDDTDSSQKEIQINSNPPSNEEESERQYSLQNSEYIDPQIEQNQLQKAQKKHRIKMILYLIFIVIANYLYFSPEKVCPYQTEQKCLKRFILLNIQTWGLAIFFTVVMLFYGLVDSIQRKMYIFTIVFLLNFIVILGIASTEISLTVYYGAFRMVFMLLLVIISLVYTVFKTIQYFYKKYGKKCFIPFILCLFAFLIYFYIKNIQNSCDTWNQGVYDEINNDYDKNGLCKVVEPEYCWYNTFDGYMDLSKLTKQCKNRDYDFDKQLYKDNYKNYFNGAKFMGFPNVNTFNATELDTNRNGQHVLQQSVFNKTQFYSTLQEAKQSNHSHDIIVDLEKQEIIQNMKKNQTLIEEREKLQQQNKDSKQQNIYIVYIDAISRAGSHRKIPKTLEYLAKKGQGPFYEFFRFHALYGSTEPNFLQLLYHTFHPMDYKDYFKKSQDRVSYPAVSIFDKIKEQGYITGHASNLCQVKSVQQNQLMRQYFKDRPMDHDAFTLGCDVNYQDPENTFSSFQGPYSIIRRCFYQKDSFQHVFDYAKQFKNTYQDQNKVVLLEFLDAHEGTGELVSYIDDGLLDFVKNVDDENSTIILMSDHGLHMQGLYFLLNLDIVGLEIALPTLMMKLANNNNFSEQELSNIKENQQKLVTMANVHTTLKQMTGMGEEQNVDFSVFQSIEDDRDCTNSDVVLPQTTCACKNPDA